MYIDVNRGLVHGKSRGDFAGSKPLHQHRDDLLLSRCEARRLRFGVETIRANGASPLSSGSNRARDSGIVTSRRANTSPLNLFCDSRRCSESDSTSTTIRVSVQRAATSWRASATISSVGLMHQRTTSELSRRRMLASSLGLLASAMISRSGSGASNLLKASRNARTLQAITTEHRWVVLPSIAFDAFDLRATPGFQSF